MKIVLGLLGCVLSIVLVVYRAPVKHFIGNIEWAEQHFGAGGTYTLILILAFGIFIFSLMYMTGTFGFLFGGITGQFFGSI